MHRRPPPMLTLTVAAALAWGTAVSYAPLARAQAPSGKIKVGFMLPYTGTYAALGTAIENGFRLYVHEQGGRLGGREVEYFKVDDESDPAKAPENASRLVKRDQVDVVVGTVHSGVQMGIVKVVKETNTLLIIPNAGVDEATGPLCGPNIFRSSFSNWQPGYAMGQVVASRGLKRVVTLTWKYAAGEQSVKGFKEAFESRGGKVVKELSLPFPNVEFQAQITEIASLKPDAVFVFFAGGGAVKFVRDWAAAGLKDKIPLFASGFLTDGTLEAQGAAAQGLETTLHYADGLTNARDKAFRLEYAKAYKLQPDVYAVQGYDAAQLLAAGATAVKGDMTRKADVYKAMEAARVDSPRGAFTLSRAHNPVQDFYLRKVDGRENKVGGVAVRALADPARGCRL
ncbi:ABC transporter substrate-binding protein [Cupriavidus plantarum]|uniref:ABC transporter substrate-binding protein n=1 Tax=Cupriavidus plantarum TaxID=942865 RepID=UPI000E27F1F8|nr:ABC transporter substrate-binding protein [Cupriavidus plantarum]REF02196.1 amino acid/amide ABC transporter substrate-binding protein (HAAT family) [Cupriavidus plantarum]CAG2130361.1 Leu/Ile/Val-binding protein [Cupriavidus plantarum]SMR66149.1 amino acid/amide ABC transporter substrate-binding protein, HAAT family [Cupriavidus plantarum]